MEQPKGTAHARYEQLCERRQPFLKRARLASRYTIPSLVPPEGANSSTDFYTPFQSIGTRGVNNLASKLQLTLFPPTRKFFRLQISEDLEKDIPDTAKSDWELALSKMEEKVLKRFETLGLRAPAFEAFRHLVVAGNVLLRIAKDGQRFYPLTQYVCRRSPEGSLLEIVVKECIDRSEIPQSVVQNVEPRLQKDGDKDVDLYTHIRLDGKRWKIYQEVKGFEIPESVGSYPKDKLPWLALRWGRQDGEDYGRSHCDEYIGDLIAAESLSRSIIRSAAISAKTIFLCNPNGITDPDDCVKAEEGDFIDGRAEDITPLGVDRAAELQTAKAVLEDITRRLSYAFLLNSAVQRNGERVTAEEIRYMAQELEDALGGSYSVLASEFQLPAVVVVMALMQKERSLPQLPDKSIVPTIVTGMDALGRNHELARLDAFIGGALQTFGPNVMGFINMSEYLKRRAACLDTDPANLILTEQQVAAQQQQAAQQAITEKVAPQVTKIVGDRLNQSPQGQVNG